MDFKKYKTVDIRDVATVERARAGKIYPGGTIYTPLSGLGGTQELVRRIAKAQTIETRYAVIVPNDLSDSEYIYTVLEEVYPVWLESFRTTINLQFDALEHLTIPYHTEKEARDSVSSMAVVVDRAIDIAKRQLDRSKDLKNSLMGDMFPNDEEEEYE